jgi:hypothetical protein
MIQRRLGERDHTATVHAVMVAVAIRRSFQRPSDRRWEAVPVLEAIGAGGAAKRAAQLVVVPEGGQEATATASRERDTERFIHNPQRSMTSQVHVRLSNRFNTCVSLRKPRNGGGQSRFCFNSCHRQSSTPSCRTPKRTAWSYWGSVLRRPGDVLATRRRIGSWSAVRIWAAVASRRCREIGSAPANGSGTSQPSPCIRGITCTW